MPATVAGIAAAASAGVAAAGEQAANSPSVYSSEQAQVNNYSDFRMAVSYVTEEGLLQVPVASESKVEKSELVRVSAPYSVKVVAWTTEREGIPPEAPSPESIDPNSCLIRREVTPAMIVPTGGGVKFFWRVSGTYHYAQVKPHQIGDDFNFGKSPANSESAPDKFPGQNLNKKYSA